MENYGFVKVLSQCSKESGTIQGSARENLPLSVRVNVFFSVAWVCLFVGFNSLTSGQLINELFPDWLEWNGVAFFQSK